MRHAFLGALRYEWIRLRSVRSTWALLLGALIAAGLLAWAQAQEIANDPLGITDQENVVSVLTGASGVAPLSAIALLAGLIGVLAFGGEYRHQLVHTTLTAIPRRGAVVAAKLVIVALFSAVVAVAASAVAYGAAFATLGDAWTITLLEQGDTPRALGGFIALVVLTGLAGLALAGLFRSTPVAAGALVLLPLLIEPVAIWLLRKDAFAGVTQIANYLPFTAGQQMVNVPGGDGPGGNLVTLGALTGGLTLLALVAATTLITTASFAARDA
jgi:ABC-type transport system involved in multi-copper enzyme maturation permease subunit